MYVVERRLLANLNRIQIQRIQLQLPAPTVTTTITSAPSLLSQIALVASSKSWKLGSMLFSGLSNQLIQKKQLSTRMEAAGPQELRSRKRKTLQLLLQDRISMKLPRLLELPLPLLIIQGANQQVELPTRISLPIPSLISQVSTLSLLLIHNIALWSTTSLAFQDLSLLPLLLLLSKVIQIRSSNYLLSLEITVMLKYLTLVLLQCYQISKMEGLDTLDLVVLSVSSVPSTRDPPVQLEEEWQVYRLLDIRLG